MPVRKSARDWLMACVAGASLATGCASEVASETNTDAPPSVAVASEALSSSLTRARCEGLSSARISGVNITTAQFIAAGSSTPEGVALPEHCLVQGKADAYTGIDNKPYAIGFEVRMPSAWNRRFLFQGGAFTDGTLTPAYGRYAVDPTSVALPKGYAVASTDGGHISEPDPVLGTALFGVDPRARINFGYNAVDRTTVVAKRLIEKAYGNGASKSYFVGCSNGGRQGMVAASRFKHFDGIVASDPGFNLPKAAVQHPWDTQWVASVGAPTFADAFSFGDLAMVGGAVTAACDGRDGLVDGIINDFSGCNFDPAVLQCAGEKSEGCLSAAQVLALKKMYGGVKNSAGKLLYSDWPWDAGVSSFDWRLWKMGPLAPELPFGLVQGFGGSALAYIFTTPPAMVPDGIAYSMTYDFDTEASKIFARSGLYTESSMEFMTPPDPSMQRLRSAGAKMIVNHAASDPVFSVNDTIRWYREFDRANNGRGRDFVRLFTVPGMTHCGGGPATDQFDMLSEIVNWVERGKAPDRIIATTRPDNFDIPAEWGTRTRPLCVWPKQARYKGTGDINKAENFTCK